MITGGRNYGGDVYLYNEFVGTSNAMYYVSEAKKRIREIVKVEPEKAKNEGIEGAFVTPPMIEVVSEGDFTRISWRATMITKQSLEEYKKDGEKPDIWARAFGEGEK